MRALKAKTARSEREESRLDDAYGRAKTHAAAVEGLCIDIRLKEAEEADLKRAMQALPPGEMFQLGSLQMMLLPFCSFAPTHRRRRPLSVL